MPTITQPTPLVVDSTYTEINLGDVVDLGIFASGGVPPYAYQWFPPTNLSCTDWYVSHLLRRKHHTVYGGGNGCERMCFLRAGYGGGERIAHVCPAFFRPTETASTTNSWYPSRE